MRRIRAFPRLFASGPGGWLLRASIGRRGWVRTILIGRGGDTCSIWADQKRPSPQPSRNVGPPVGRGGRPRCLVRYIDLKDRVDYGFTAEGARRWNSSISPNQSSQFPGGRGSRPRCLVRYIDLNDRIDYGFTAGGARRCHSPIFPDRSPLPLGEG
jgi:hypothetical protein